MKKQNKIVLFATFLLSASLLAGCGGDETEKTQIGVLQFGSFTALENVKKGFVKTLEGSKLADQISFNIQNPQANSTTNTQMAATLAAESDLVLGIATPSATALKSAVDSVGTGIPVLFAAVTNPIGANLVNDLVLPGENVTGVTDLGPIAEGLQLVLDFGGVDQVTSLFTATETNSVYQAGIAEAFLSSKGVSSSRTTITNAGEITSAIASIPEEVDAVFIATDDTIANSISLVRGAVESLDASRSKPLIVFGADSGLVEGTTFSMGIDYEASGVQVAKQALKILQDGAQAGSLSVESCDNHTISINKTFAEKEGLDLPESLLSKEGATIL